MMAQINAAVNFRNPRERRNVLIAADCFPTRWSGTESTITEATC
jgi:hypothetical protein